VLSSRDPARPQGTAP